MRVLELGLLFRSMPSRDLKPIAEQDIRVPAIVLKIPVEFPHERDSGRKLSAFKPSAPREGYRILYIIRVRVRNSREIEACILLPDGSRPADGGRPSRVISVPGDE